MNVSSGIAWLKMNEQWGMVAPNPATISLTVDVGDTILNRIDVACLRIDKNQSVQEVVIKKGSLAASPVYPALVRDLNYDEIFLATISIPAGTTELNASLITDLRLDETYCGIMRDGVTGIPTQALYDAWWAWFSSLQHDTEAVFSNYQQLANDLYIQYLAEIAAHESNALAAYDAFVARMGDYETTAQADFEAWVATLKDILDEEVAGHLQLEIEELQTRFPTDVLGTVSTEPTTQRLYPTCALFSTTWAAGIGGAGNGPAGGGSVVAIETDQSFAEYDLTVTAPASYKNYTNINPVSNTMYAFMAADAADTQSLVLKIAKEA